MITPATLELQRPWLPEYRDLRFDWMLHRADNPIQVRFDNWGEALVWASTEGYSVELAEEWSE